MLGGSLFKVNQLALNEQRCLAMKVQTTTKKRQGLQYPLFRILTTPFFSAQLTHKMQFIRKTLKAKPCLF